MTLDPTPPPETNDALDGTYSSLREKTLEHAFLTELARALWRAGRRDYEVLRAEVDRGGYDVVVECGGVIRHIQLKSRHREGKAQHVSLALGLATKPSGCAVWMDYDPHSLEIGPFLWFGGAPGKPLPSLGDKVTRHSKGGQERLGHRLVKRSAFTRLPNIDAVAAALFGSVAGRVTSQRAAALRALAELVPGFHSVTTAGDPEAAVGSWVLTEHEPTIEDVIAGPPRYQQGDLLQRFVSIVDDEWLLPGFGWMAWRDTAEAVGLRTEPDTVAKATETQLAQLLTALVRQERFQEGTLAEAARSGLILRICERAAVLGVTDPG